MKADYLLREIEDKYPVDEIISDNIRLWQFLRFRFHLALYLKHDVGDEQALPYFLKQSGSIINLILNSLKSIFALSKKKGEYLLYTDISEIKHYDNKYFDKIAHNIIEQYGANLNVIINTSNQRTAVPKFSVNNAVNASVFYLFSLKYNKKFTIENENVLKNIEQDYGVSIDYHKKIKRFLSLVRCMNHYFKKRNYKVLFINTYYSPVINHAMVFAAKMNGIRVIDLQHGMISPGDAAYTTNRVFDAKGIPDAMMVFGEHYKEVIIKNKFLASDRIGVAGNYYINLLRKTSDNSTEIKIFISEIRKRHHKIIAVTSQATIENELIDFVNQVAALNKNFFYLFIPRHFDNPLLKSNFEDNVFIDFKMGFYKLIPWVDFHSTVYSTCAIESLAFGIPNILININNLSTNTFGSLLGKENYTYYCNTKEDYIQQITNLSGFLNKEILEASKPLYSYNDLNIKEFVDKIQLLS